MSNDFKKIHVRQVEHRSNLPRLSDAAKPTLKTILPNLDSELTPIFELRESATPNLTLNIGAGKITNADTGLSRAFFPIQNLSFDFTGGTVTFPATTGGAIVVTPGVDDVLNVSSGNYIAVLVQIDSLGDLSVAIGTEAATAADAINNDNFPVHFKKVLPIGYVVLHNSAGTIQNVVNENITQFVGGGGGGGTGDANELLERLKNRADASTYEYMTPVIFASTEDELVDLSSTAEFSVVDSNYEFANAGDFVLSKQMFDVPFLESGTEPRSIELVHYWNLDALDEAATYEVSRDGGNNWQTISMERVGVSDTYYGAHTFTEEPSNSYVQVVGGSPTNKTPFTDSNQLSRQFSLTNAATIKKITANMTVSGSPTGFMYALVVRDDGLGSPSLAVADRVGQSSFVSASTMVSGNVEFDIRATLEPGNYHVIFKTDDFYKIEYTASAGANKIEIDSELGGIVYSLEGMELDLRVRVTSSAAGVFSEGFGIFYQSEERVTLVDGNILRHQVSFVGDVDNLAIFELPFTPEPRLLNVYEIGTGLTFRYGAFVLDGKYVIFEPNTFNKPETVTLEFLQVQGSSFDNSDSNRALLAANHLGSLDPTIDLSVAGRGFLLRSDDGTLYEIVIKDGGKN
jgi:hypothetical protein